MSHHLRRWHAVSRAGSPLPSAAARPAGYQLAALFAQPAASRRHLVPRSARHRPHLRGRQATCWPRRLPALRTRALAIGGSAPHLYKATLRSSARQQRKRAGMATREVKLKVKAKAPTESKLRARTNEAPEPAA